MGRKILITPLYEAQPQNTKRNNKHEIDNFIYFRAFFTFVPSW